MRHLDTIERRKLRERADRIEDNIMGAQMAGKDVAKTIAALRKAADL